MLGTLDQSLEARRRVLNAVLTGADVLGMRCSDECTGRAEQTVEGKLAPGESLVPRTCPTVSWHLIWLRQAGLVIVDEGGIRPTAKARRGRRPVEMAHA